MTSWGPAAANLDNALAELANLKEEFNERVVAYRSKVADFNRRKAIYQRNWRAYDNQINTTTRNENIAGMAPRRAGLQQQKQLLDIEANELLAIKQHIDTVERTIGSQFKMETSPFWKRGQPLPPLQTQMQMQPVQSQMRSQPVQPFEPKSYPDLLCPSIKGFIQAPPKTYKEISPVIKTLKSYARPELANEIKELDSLKPGWFKSPNISRASGPLQALSSKLSCGIPAGSGSKQRVSRYCDSISKLISKPVLTYSNIEAKPEIMVDVGDSYPANIAALRKLKPGWFGKPSSDKLKAPLTTLYNKMECGRAPREVRWANAGGLPLTTASSPTLNNTGYGDNGLLPQSTTQSTKPWQRTAANALLQLQGRPGEPAPPQSGTRTGNNIGDLYGGGRLARRSRKAGGRSRSQRRTRRTKSNTRLNKRSHKRR